MTDSIKQIIVGFFKNIKCDIVENEKSIVVSKIPENISKNFEIDDIIEINFENNGQGKYIDASSDLFKKIKTYLSSIPSKTLLKLDFEFPSNIKERIPLKNCSISKIEKKHENNYFSRFSILSSFRYLNNAEQLLNDIFVHEGVVVKGDLSNYDVKEGDSSEASTKHLSVDYEIAKDYLQKLIEPKLDEISKKIDKELSVEIERIEDHYSNILEEFNLNKSRLQRRIDEIDSEEEIEKTEKLKDMFDNNFSEKEFCKILDEKKDVIENERMRFSIDLENKLINTTIIYYPIFKIYLMLGDAKTGKEIEIIFNPLTNEMTNFYCDSCNSELREINLCQGGHICCDSCLYLCSECGKRYCKDCMSGMCGTCGKLICKNCVRICEDCKNLFCKNCVRVSSLTGKEKCQNCISYCPKCSKIVEKKSMIRNSSGLMICKSCSSKK